ncbi:MAG: PEGA domain-containing protein, partial [Gemmatimonadales bacterium]
ALSGDAAGGAAGARVSAAFANITTPLAASALSDAPTMRFKPLRRRRAVVLSIAAGVVLLGGAAWAVLRPNTAANGATSRLPDSVTQRPGATPIRTAPPAAAGAVTPRQPVAHVKMSVNTQPPGMLFLDGTAVRSTPIVGLDITVGRHRVQVRRDGYAPFDTVVTAQPGQDIKLTRNRLRQL